MTFRITLTRLPIAVDFEVGSLAEGVAILEQEDSAIKKIVAMADQMSVDAVGNVHTEALDAAAAPDKPRRGRKPNQPDPTTAAAPAPLPVPGATPAPPAAASDGIDIPANLKRDANNQAPAMAAAPPPVAPPPPLIPPSGILAGKVIANLDQRKAATVDNGAALVDWLAGSGIVNKGVSYDEAIAVVRLMPDDKLGQVATALAVA